MRKGLTFTALAVALIAAPALAKDKVLAAPINMDAPPSAAFTDSSAALLSGTKRVAITSVVICFQSSTGARAGASFFLPVLTSRAEVLSVLAMPGMNSDLQDALAANAYAALADQLKAQGFELVPQDQIRASASYQAILKQGGYANHSRFANAMGDIELVGPAGLPTYTAYHGELGNFHYPSKSYMGWADGMGLKSVTPGGPSYIQMSNAWKVPGLEVALAKELNAHVVKAYYVVSLGKTDARRSTDFAVKQGWGELSKYPSLGNVGTYTAIERTVTGKGTALAQVGLVQDQSRISFRTPTGNAKWQKVSMIAGTPAPKDGDVVIHLASPLYGGTDFFSVSEGQIPRQGGGMFSSQQKADITVGFVARVSDQLGYGKEVSGMIASANKAMLELVKQ